jgi:hypothetical protein
VAIRRVRETTGENFNQRVYDTGEVTAMIQ